MNRSVTKIEKISSNIQEAQIVMLKLLDVFVGICESNGLHYWLGSGTLLGAVRHKGFIPWDDDLDVMMPRDDYQKFLLIAHNYLPKSVFLQTRKTDKYYDKDYAKLRDCNSRIVEPGELKGVKYHQGLFIDIFPMDIVDKNKRGLYATIKHFFIKEQIWSLRLKILPRLLNIIGCFFFIFINKSKMMDIINKWVYSNSKDSYLAYGFDVPFERFIPCVDIYPLKKIIFCNKEYLGPSNPDNYLRITYGNYMEIPPIEKREAHAVSIEIF